MEYKFDGLTTSKSLFVNSSLNEAGEDQNKPGQTQIQARKLREVFLHESWQFQIEMCGKYGMFCVQKSEVTYGQVW